MHNKYCSLKRISENLANLVALFQLSTSLEFSSYLSPKVDSLFLGKISKNIQVCSFFLYVFSPNGIEEDET